MLTYLIAAIWLVNGLYCKVLHQVPRHQAIVARILGEKRAPLFTQLIGWAEIAMAIWIVSGFARKFNGILQIAIILAMNLLEFILVPDLLLWGRFNLVFALLLVAVIGYHNFYRSKPIG